MMIGRRLVLAAVAASVMLTTLPAVASANYHGQPWLGSNEYAPDYTWKEWGGGRWQDNRCGTSAEEFNVTLYQHTNYGGYKVKVCARGTGAPGNVSAFSSWCKVPLAPTSNFGSSFECAAYGWNTVKEANDDISSIKVNSIKGSQPKCMRIFQKKDYGGEKLTFKDDLWSLDIWPMTETTWNDRASSMRRKNNAQACDQSVD